MRASRPVLLTAVALLVGGGLGALPSASAAAAPSTPLFFHSASGSYTTDYAADPTAIGRAPKGSTLTAEAPTETAAATASYVVGGLRGQPNVPLWSIPVSGTVTSACLDLWVSSEASQLFGEVHVVAAIVPPGAAATSFSPLAAPYAGGVARVTGKVDLPAATVLPPGSALQLSAQYLDDGPLTLHYDAVARPSAITLNPTACGTPVVDPGTGGSVPSDGSVAFATHSPPDAFGQRSGEPSIGYSEKTGTTFVQGGFDTMAVAFDDTTGTSTWTVAQDQLLTQLISLDPIGYTDRETGRTFVSQLVGACSLTEFSDDDGASWQPSQGCGLPHGVDHQTLGGGPFGAGVVGATYDNAVYYCSQSIVSALCAQSRDGGQTFGQGTPIYTSAQCGGLHGHVKVAPDGTVYVPNKSCGGKVGVAVQTDPNNVAPWTVRTVPDSTVKSPSSDPSVAADSSGRIYLGYQDARNHPMVAVSDDRGLTWSRSVDVGATLGIQNMQFAAVVGGDDGRAAYAFLGTTTPGNDQDINAFKGEWHLYVAMTYDGGATWSTVNATPGDPVQRGSICVSGTTCGADRNLLDFNGITYDGQGRVMAVFADGCIRDCVTNPAVNTRARVAGIARQTSGRTLLAEFDPAPLTATTTTYTGATSVRSGSALAVSAAVTQTTSGAPLVGAPVTFTLGDQVARATTGEDGVASASLPVTEDGTLVVSYAGTSTTAESTARVPIDVYAVRLVPSASTSTPVSGEPLDVTVRAVRDDGTVDVDYAETPVLTTTDASATVPACGAAVAGVSRCAGVVLGSLGTQTVSASGGATTGSADLAVQPVAIAFSTAPTTASRGAAVTYVTTPVAGVDGASLAGYRAVQSISTDDAADRVPGPQQCAGATCSFSVTFDKAGKRTVTARDDSTPSRSATTGTQVKGR